MGSSAVLGVRMASPKNAVEWVGAFPESLELESSEHDSLTLFGELDAVLECLPGTWVDATSVTDRRIGQRFFCDFPAWLSAIDGDSQLRAEPAVAVRVKDISRQGIGLVHSEPLAHRLALVRFAAPEAPAAELIVRLQWCRFRGPGDYESGGQIQRVTTPASRANEAGQPGGGAAP